MRERLVFALVGSAIVLAGCSAGPAPQAASPAVSSVDGMDRYDARDEAFFDALRLRSATIRQPPKDLDAAAHGSTVVMMARVKEVRATRTVQGEASDDALTFIGVVLQPVEVLYGKPRAELPEVVVEFIHPGGGASPDLSRFQQGLPQGVSVWFLRWKGTPRAGASLPPGSPTEAEKQYYVLTSQQGLFIQGKTAVACAVAEDLPDSVAKDTMMGHGRRFAKLSELATYIRRLT